MNELYYIDNDKDPRNRIIRPNPVGIDTPYPHQYL